MRWLTQTSKSGLVLAAGGKPAPKIGKKLTQEAKTGILLAEGAEKRAEQRGKG